MNGREARTGGPTQPMSRGSVKHLIGKPAARWTVDDLVSMAGEQGIRSVSLMHVGIDGWMKTLDFVPRSDTHLRDILDGGERADGSSLFSGTGIRPEDSDVVLRPRIPTAFLDPFSHQPALALLCEHLAPDGTPLPESPDTIINRAEQRLLRLTGAELLALGEVEYFLGKKPDEEDIYGADDRGYHATAPFVFGEPLRRNAMAILSDIGVGVKYGHSEVGYVEADDTDDFIWEQHEIELALAPLTKAADAVVLTQWVLRNLAHANRMRCSFDPIVRRGHAGSGLHFHLAPMRNGVPLYSPHHDMPLPEEVQWLIGGLLLMGGALMAFGNRAEDSFIRLSQGKEAPLAVTWGRFNRHALIRLPIQVTTEAGRVVTQPTIEFRLPDGSAHPYLVLAGIAQAMLLGRDTDNLEALLSSTEVTNSGNPPREAAQVPRNFGEVAKALEKHSAFLSEGDVFPPAMLESTREQLLGAK